MKHFLWRIIYNFVAKVKENKMKKIFWEMLVIALAFVSGGLFAQQPVVAVAPFDAISGINSTEANMITRVFFIRLGNTNKVSLVDRSVVERVLREHSFQAGDWSDQKKTAELGTALNADWIVRGEMEKFGSNILVTVQFYDIRTFRFMGGADLRLANADEAYDKMDPLVDRLVETISASGTRLPAPRTQGTVGTSSSTEIAIEVTTKEGGILSFDGKEIATLWDNDIHTIPIERPGTFTIKMIFGNGIEKIRSVAVTSRGITKVDFSIPIVGEIGPAGGLVFYDKGNNSDGWRFLEAAPAETEFSAQWGAKGQDIAGTGTAVGSGKRNTQLIVEYLNRRGESGRAAQLCTSISFDGFTDWFLPSRDELNLMYQNLKKKGLGNFHTSDTSYASWYLSSSQIDSNRAWPQSFVSGDQDGTNNKDSPWAVRAIRSF
jgi:TolB-like protein